MCSAFRPGHVENHTLALPCVIKSRRKQKKTRTLTVIASLWQTLVRVFTCFMLFYVSLVLLFASPPLVSPLFLFCIVFQPPQCLNMRELRCIIIHILLPEGKLLRSHHLSNCRSVYVCFYIYACVWTCVRTLCLFSRALFCYFVVLGSWLGFCCALICLDEVIPKY